jgi:hypothetical protein
MAKLDSLTVRLRIIYDGTPPNVWDGGAKDFGLQDKANVLHLGKAERDGRVVFEVELPVKPEKSTSPVFLGDFAHGPPKERFLYLSWRNANGAYAQRLKLPLGTIGWSDHGRSAGQDVSGAFIDVHERPLFGDGVYQICAKRPRSGPR